MYDTIDTEVINLCNRKLWDIVRLSAIVDTDTEFLVEVLSEIKRRDSGGEADRMRRYLQSASLVDADGRETPITEKMVATALSST